MPLQRLAHNLHVGTARAEAMGGHEGAEHLHLIQRHSFLGMPEEEWTARRTACCLPGR